MSKTTLAAIIVVIVAGSLIGEGMYLLYQSTPSHYYVVMVSAASFDECYRIYITSGGRQLVDKDNCGAESWAYTVNSIEFSLQNYRSNVQIGLVVTRDGTPCYAHSTSRTLSGSC